MNIGKRIVERLAELKWQRRDLLDAVDDLSAQALSNLIVRDSKRSEWDQQIAKALGVSVMWLVYGEESSHTDHIDDSPELAKVHDFHGEKTQSVIEIMAQLDEGRKADVLTYAKERLTLQLADQNSTKRAGL